MCKRKDILDKVQSMYPFEPRIYETEQRLRMSYLDEGEGPPLLLVHGNPSWSFYWRELVLALRGHRRIIAPDHIGCGLSQRVSDRDYGYSLSDRINDLSGLIAHTGIDKTGFDMAVHDWGGAIGVGAASRIPESLKSLVITNTSLFTLPPGRPFHRELRFARSWPGRFLIRYFNAFSVGASRMCTVRPLPSEVRKAYTAPYSGFDNTLATLKFVMDIPLKPEDRSWNDMKSIEEFAESINNPTLLLWGMKDFIFDELFYNEFERRMKGLTCHKFENAGHYLMEDAGPEVTSLIDNFLNNNQ